MATPASAPSLSLTSHKPTLLRHIASSASLTIHPASSSSSSSAFSLQTHSTSKPPDTPLTIHHHILPSHSPQDSLLPSALAGLTLRPGDIWSQVALRVIPLFTGEGHKGFVEDLNDLVSQHIHKTISDSPSKSILKLNADLVDLLSNGLNSLTLKLQSDHLSDQRLLLRLLKLWHFFFTAVLPYLEAIFLPLTTDHNLLNVIESKNNKVLQEKLQQQHLLQQATSHAGLLSSSSSSILFRSTNRIQPSIHSPQPTSRHRQGGPHALRASSAPDESIHAINVRRLALIAFRDHLIQPIFTRLYRLFGYLYDPTLSNDPSSAFDGSLAECQSEELHSNRLQLVGLLCSVQTDDANQTAIEELAKLIRLAKVNPRYFHSSSSSSCTTPTPSSEPSSNSRLISNRPLASSAINSNPYPHPHHPNQQHHHHHHPPPHQESDRSHDSSRLQAPLPNSSKANAPTTNLGSSRHTRSADGTPGIDPAIVLPSGGRPVQQADHQKPLGHRLHDDGSQAQIKGWNKNRDFARRSIRRQLGRSGASSGTVSQTSPSRRSPDTAPTSSAAPRTVTLSSPSSSSTSSSTSSGRLVARGRVPVRPLPGKKGRTVEDQSRAADPIHRSPEQVPNTRLPAETPARGPSSPIQTHISASSSASNREPPAHTMTVRPVRQHHSPPAAHQDTQLNTATSLEAMIQGQIDSISSFPKTSVPQAVLKPKHPKPPRPAPVLSATTAHHYTKPALTAHPPHYHQQASPLNLSVRTSAASGAPRPNSPDLDQLHDTRLVSSSGSHLSHSLS